ncbi:MAG: VWA domain-containing protein [Gammaproteobacteria bacterium]|nr:VWA domain-containing protein [Gammaproteobacteria bacterium]MCP5136169.1 VWA domain-containing protein [Gammaproteobacteria bacterium]
MSGLLNIDWAAFHFAQIEWLWALLMIPPMLFWRRRQHAARSSARYRAYADGHLLPHLLVGAGRQRSPGAGIWHWVAMWTFGTLALAGPRWDYTEIVFQQPDRSLVVLLDISRSMDVDDVAPSRLRVARREIEDLIEGRGEVRIGIVVFASIAHTVAPITEDSAALRRLLPYLDSSLGALGGSRLEAGLHEARRLLGLGQRQPSNATPKATPNQRGVLLISDGDFDISPGLEEALQTLAREGVTVHVLGIGTREGGPVPVIDANTGDRALLIGPDRQPIRSRLEAERLQRLALAGGGLYLYAGQRGDNSRRLLDAIRSEATVNADAESRRIWHERFYLPVALMLLMMAPWWMRRRRPA